MTSNRMVTRGGETERQLPPSDGTSCPNCGFAWNQHDKGNCPRIAESAMQLADKIMARYWPPSDKVAMNEAIERCKLLMSKHRMMPTRGGIYAPKGGLT